MDYIITLYVDEYEPVWELRPDPENEGRDRFTSVGKQLYFEDEKFYVLPDDKRKLIGYLKQTHPFMHNGSEAQDPNLEKSVHFIRLEKNGASKIIERNALDDLLKTIPDPD